MKIFNKISIAIIILMSSLLAEQYFIDKAHSSITFEVKHLVISTIIGKIGKFDGNLDFDLSTKKIISLNGDATTESINTENRKRDKHLKGKDFFYSSKYPTMSFKMIKLIDKTMEVYLTIRGVTKKVKFEYDLGGTIKGPYGKERVAFQLVGKINRDDFKLSWNRFLETGGAIVGKKVKIIINIQGIAKK